MSDRIELRVSAELLERLDAARGDVPRGTFIKRALESALGRDEAGESRGHSEQTRDGAPVSPRTPDEPVANVLGSPVRKVPSLKETWGR